MSSGSTVERAFALARSGNCRTLSDIRAALKRERCDAVELHLAGTLIQRQLKAAMLAPDRDDPPG